MRVTLEPHNPEWAVLFEQSRGELFKLLHKTPPIFIEHVGSTSVPGLLAKPVLDIDIVVKRENLTATRDTLVSAGYTDLGEMGIPGRVGFREPGYSKNSSDGSDAEFGMRRNIYAVLEGSLSLRNHLDTKSVLLRNEVLRDEYSEVKRKLAAMDVEKLRVYCKGKTEILLKILRDAGWNEEELEEIARVNA